MKRFRLLAVALLSVCAFGAVTASVSQAETAPYFTVGGTRLVAGKTHNFDARVFKKEGFTLTNPTNSIRILCEALGTEQGVLLGSNPGSPGKDDEITVFSQCALVAGNGFPDCELANADGEPTTVIKTEPIKSEQVENVENSKVGKKLYEEFLPANRANGFATLHFTGTQCTVTEAVVSGTVAGEVLLDMATGPENIELGDIPEEKRSYLVRFPAPPITQVWLISGAGGKIQPTGLIAFGASALLTGINLTLLANTKFEPEPNALWSPLP